MADAFAEFAKTTAKIADDHDSLLAFYDFPAEHWGATLHYQHDRVDLFDRRAQDQVHPRYQLTPSVRGARSRIRRAERVEMPAEKVDAAAEQADVSF